MAKGSPAKSRSLYGVHPGVAMVRKWLEELKEETGRSMTHRIEITAVEQIDGEVKKWLKTAYDLDT